MKTICQNCGENPATVTVKAFRLDSIVMLDDCNLCEHCFRRERVSTVLDVADEDLQP